MGLDRIVPRDQYEMATSGEQDHWHINMKLNLYIVVEARTWNLCMITVLTTNEIHTLYS